MNHCRYKTDSQRLMNKRFKAWTWKLLVGSILVVFSLGRAGKVSGRERSEIRRQDKGGSAGKEKIVCRESAVKANRGEILKFIESFCAEAIGQEFGDGTPNSELKELYTIDPAHRVPGDGMASHVLLHLRSINGCSFSVDYSCGRFLTRPTDECNIGDEAKQGGYVANGCSLWRTIPML